MRDVEFDRLSEMVDNTLLNELRGYSQRRQDQALEFLLTTLFVLPLHQEDRCTLTEQHLSLLNDWIHAANSNGYYSIALREAKKIWHYIDPEASGIQARLPQANTKACFSRRTLIGFGRAFGKALRLNGEYDLAADVYRKTLQWCNGPDVDYLQGQIILALGKTAHTHLWRVGYYRCLTKLAENRFRRALKVDEATIEPVLRHLAICIDSATMLDCELLTSGASELPGRAQIQALSGRWKGALWYARESGSSNSVSRIMCRSNYALFQLWQQAGSAEGSCRAFEKFREGLRLLEDLPSDQRGIAVRYGQFAEMLTYFGQTVRAAEYLREAIDAAESTRDWRSLANNYLRLARMAPIGSKPPIQQLNFALQALAKLSERLPEMEIRIRRELSQQLWNIGDYQGSERCMDQLRAKIGDLENRLLLDIRGLEKPGSIFQLDTKMVRSVDYIPQSVLRRGERSLLHDALFVDFRLYAFATRHFLADLSATRDFASRKTTTLRQLEFFLDLFSGYAHRIKGRIEQRIAAVEAIVSGSLSDPLQQDPRAQSVLISLNEERRQLQYDFRYLLSGVDNLPKDTAAFTSVVSEFRKLISQEDSSGNAGFSSSFKMVEFVVLEVSDVYLHCHSEVLALVLGNLLANSAREASRASNQSRAVVARISWHSGDRSYGRIEILDTGFRADDLKAALKAGWSKGTYGLPHAIAFFSSFSATFDVMLLEDAEVAGVLGNWTCLTIDIPISNRVGSNVEE